MRLAAAGAAARIAKTMTFSPTHTLARLSSFDHALCVRWNRARWPVVEQWLRLASRLGDGVFWYVLMALLPLLYGRAGGAASLRMLAVGAVGLGVYKIVKQAAARPRPYLASAEITLRARPLDRYAFPSGHTMHAVAFSWIAIATEPLLAWALVPFTLLVAASRVALGLHYPSDVFAGALLGGALAAISYAW